MKTSDYEDSRFCVDDYNRPISEINRIIENGDYKFTGKTITKIEFMVVSSSAGYYRKVVYKETTGGLWIKAK